MLPFEGKKRGIVRLFDNGKTPMLPFEGQKRGIITLF
jgi:hypothetical protein